MLLDGYLMFSNGQVLTATADSSNIIDIQNARDLGIGEDVTLKVFVSTGAALVSAGATTLNVDFQGSTDGTTWTSMWLQSGITKANITATGTRIASFDLPRPAVGQAMPRYYKIVYTVGTGPFTGGSVNAGIVLDDQASPQYASALNIQN